MKKQILILFILAACCTPAMLFAAALTPADFQYCAGVEGTLKAETLYQIHLSGEIISKAGAGLQDLRIFDSSQRETPLVMIENVPPHETIETYPLEITGYNSDASSATVTMKLPQKHRPISVMDLMIADRDFKKRVALFGSSDGKTWQPVTEDSIYDFSSQVNVRKTKIEFAKTDYRYFRLKLTDFKPQAGAGPSIKLKYEGLDFSVNGVLQKKDLRIQSVEGSTQTPSEKKPVYDLKTFDKLAPTLDKDGNTVIILQADLPIDRLTFDIANPYYYRTVTVYGSGTGKEDSYRYLTSQVIYRFPLSSDQHEEKAYLEQRVPKQAYYKVVIMNKNNPPLELKGLTFSWVQQNLYFIALKNNERYSLCFGNPRVKRPDYDIANFVNQNTLSQNVYARVELASLRASGGPRPTLRDRFAGMEKLVLKIVVILLVIGMGLWLYALMKKAPEKK
jgi:hypothetical protein